MPRVTRSKLANRSERKRLGKRSKPPFNNEKNRLTGPVEDSRRNPRASRVKGFKNSQLSQFGTARAFKDKVLGSATTSGDSAQLKRPREQPAKPKIGGSRASKVEQSRRGRRSTALRLSEVQNIMAAAVFTAENTVPLNRHTTIHFDAAGIVDPVEALRRYTKLARDWLRTQGAPFAYIWVRESGDAKGEHAHLLMHVPARLVQEFARREPSWRKRIGARRNRTAFKTTPVGKSYRHAQVGLQYGERYSDALQGIVGYVVKGAEPRAVAALGLDRVAPGGELWGKRCGMSENINRTARGRASQK